MDSGAVALAETGEVTFLEPQLVPFAGAFEFIQKERLHHAVSLVALDQPTIVPNLTGMRPVERVAGSLISYIGGGVQPANRGKTKMFGDDAPIWSFLDRRKGCEFPHLSGTGVVVLAHISS